ncbi:ABC transporter permease [Pseudomonas sp. 15FMM2]|uniref:ABC transporter permease n=1 Tax=Pseudomonas imrae TaxID=2992837 RepID=A0ACC7PEN2_9PSED
MKLLPAIFKRQLISYFSLPITYLCIVTFLIANAALGFYAGNFLAKDETDLSAFFQHHPWLYLAFIPAICVHLWSDEHIEGAQDFFSALPVSAFELTSGKFMAAWMVCGLTLLSTFPTLVILKYLGTPDDGIIIAQYLGSWLLSGVYLSVGCFICVVTRNRLIIFSSTMGLLLATSILFSIIDALDHQIPIFIVDSLMTLSPSTRFDTITSGLLTSHDILYFASMILAFLTATSVTLNFRHG